MSRPPLNALHTFAAVARLGSFAAAAEELHVTAAAVSGQIRKLEAYLELKLFDREPRGVALTDAGTALRDEVSAGLDAVERAVLALRKRPQRER